MKNDKRYTLFCDMIHELDLGFDLITEYDAQLHNYEGTILYQSEAHLLKLIGRNPGISASKCASILKKTNSACSQIVKKLRSKGWIIQKLNPKNNRAYNLFLTESGKNIFLQHSIFEDNAYRRTYHLLDSFSDKDLETYRKIQQKLNEGFAMDVEDSRTFN